MKNKIMYKYAICLIMGAIMLYIALNSFYFLKVTYEYSNLISTLFPGIFAMVTLCIFKWISEKDFKEINSLQTNSSNNLENIEEKNNGVNKKNYKYFWIIFLVYTLIFAIVGVNNISFKENLWNTEIRHLSEMNFLLPYENTESLEMVKRNLNMDFFKNVTISFLPFIFLFFIFYRSFIIKKRSDGKWWKKIPRVISVIFTIFGSLLSIYYIVDIPEFKYQYETTKTGIIVNGYSNLKDYYSNDYMKIPEKIAGKTVVGLGSEPFFYLENIYISSKFPKKFFYGMVMTSAVLKNSKIHMYGEPMEWYEADGIIYSIDGTEILYINTEDLYVKEDVTQVNEIAICMADFFNSIKVAKNNDIFFAYDNVLYKNEEIIDESGEKILGTVALIPLGKNDENIILPAKINNTLYFGYFGNKTFVIPKEFDELIEFADASSGFNVEYIVEEGNTIYEVYEGSLYTKGLEKMIALRENKENTTIMFPTELKEFGKQCLYDIVDMLSKNKEYKIQIDEKNPYFIIKDDLIYNQDGTKLLTPAKYMKTIKIEENVKEISEPILLYYDGNMEVSDKNQYFIVNENGEVKKKIENN